VVRAAAERARRGEGPTLIEAVTYRMGAHSSADDPTRYRPDAELAVWSVQDPIARYERWLKQEGMLDHAGVEAVRADAEAAAQAMRTKLIATPVPPPTEVLFDRVYSTAPRTFEAERNEFAATLEPTE
jgi:pyruvate dehydrogenase E1 component alpha subunit